VLAGRHAQSVHEVAGGIISTGGKALAVEWDISDLSAVGDRANEIEKDIGWVDILVNNSGGPPPTPAAGQDIAVWQAQYRSMVLSVIAITDRVLPRMRQRGWGRIITSTRRAPLRQRSTPQRLATRRLSPHSGTQPGAATSPRRATLPPCNPTPPIRGICPDTASTHTLAKQLSCRLEFNARTVRSTRASLNRTEAGVPDPRAPVGKMTQQHVRGPR
jgi:NAD(P)-dependent dehydrogenase (short-subunit alcohol dehydrogenase family)